MALSSEVTAPYLPSTPEVTLPPGTIVIFPEKVPVAFGGTGTVDAIVSGKFVMGVDFSGEGVSVPTLYPIQNAQAGFTGSGSFQATPIQVYSVQANFSGAGLLEAEREEFIGIKGLFNGSGSLSGNAIPVIISGFSGSGTVQAFGYAYSAGFSGSGSATANITKVGLLSANFSGTGTASATLITFTPTEMDKSGTYNMGTRATVTGWVADTANFPGSVVSNNALVVVGSKVNATVAASVNVNAFNAGHNVYLMHNGVQIDTASGSFTTTYSLSATRNVSNGNLITIEASRSSGSATVQVASTWVRVS